ncbi:MAG: hypothetical protein OXL34_11595 [Gemmatimonadota bacterium]|nr:hypothetical protein [Gemmatimonadota bacterium]
MSGEMWGGIAGFLVLSGGLIAIWRALSCELREIRDNHLRHTDEKITGIATRLDQTDKRIGRLDERLKEARQERRADIRDAKTELSAHIQASEGRLHAAIENLRREPHRTPG